MARTTGPLFSLDASGSVGGAITFSKWKGRNYVRRRVIPSNPKSGAQVGRRAMVAFLAQQWASLSAADQAEWQPLADQLVASRFNAYVGWNMSQWHNFIEPSQQYPADRTLTPSDNALVAAAWEENRIKLALSGSALGDAWGILIFGSLGATVTPSVGTTVLVPADTTIAAHNEYWTPHVGAIGAEWTFNTIAFSTDGNKAAAGGPQTTP